MDILSRIPVGRAFALRDGVITGKSLFQQNDVVLLESI